MLKTCFAAVLAFGIAGVVSPALGEEPDAGSPVTGLRMAGPDLEVFLSAPPPGDAAAVLFDAGGNAVVSGAIEVVEGEARAVLTGALAAIAAHGPAWRVQVMDGDGSVLGGELPFLVALHCPPGAPCRFELLPGLSAPGTALVDPALSRALDELPAGTADQLAAAVAVDPSLRGAALTAAWTWASLPVPPKGLCGCIWALEPSLSGGAGLTAGLTALAVPGEDGLRIEQVRTASVALRRRCGNTVISSTETVAVAAEDGSWSTVLEIPRVVLSGCPAPCAADVAWETEVEGRSLAQVEGAPGARAEVSWEGEVMVDGTEVLHVEDEASTVPGPGGEALRRAQWTGDGELVVLRAAARAEIAAPGQPVDAGAIAAVAWRFAGVGVSDCAWPERVEVVASSRPRAHSLFQLGVSSRPCEPRHLGILISDGRLCMPGRKR